MLISKETLSIDPVEKAAFLLYNLGWKISIPALRLNHRLSEGFGQRTLQYELQPADLWIQAASAGESYLAWELLKNLRPVRPVNILVTANTSQGIDVLTRAINEITSTNGAIRARAAYFPFDKPALMQEAVKSICPKVMVFLETEIWPGLLAALKKHGCYSLIINGRITPKSMSRYLIWPSLWRKLRPEKVLAVSKNDADRFASLFGRKDVDIMPNMKFDRIDVAQPVKHKENPLEKIIRPDTTFIVIGSVRQEEEKEIEKIIVNILQRHPYAVIGLFPRHMHRIDYWRKALKRMELQSILRSRTKTHVASGTVILWDIFGELPLAYRLSKAVFVGGSLAPLGGQNFLEALICGIIPVIGPFWDNFSWVGREIVVQKLIRVAKDWKEAANFLSENVKDSPAKEKVRKAAVQYMKDRRGGTDQACRIIDKIFDGNSAKHGN